MLFVINMSSVCLIYTLFNFKLEFSFDDIYKYLFSKGIYKYRAWDNLNSEAKPN